MYRYAHVKYTHAYDGRKVNVPVEFIKNFNPERYKKDVAYWVFWSPKKGDSPHEMLKSVSEIPEYDDDLVPSVDIDLEFKGAGYHRAVVLAVGETEEILNQTITRKRVKVVPSKLLGNASFELSKHVKSEAKATKKRTAEAGASPDQMSIESLEKKVKRMGAPNPDVTASGSADHVLAANNANMEALRKTLLPAEIVITSGDQTNKSVKQENSSGSTAHPELLHRKNLVTGESSAKGSKTGRANKGMTSVHSKLINKLRKKYRLKQHRYEPYHQQVLPLEVQLTEGDPHDRPPSPLSVKSKTEGTIATPSCGKKSFWSTAAGGSSDMEMGNAQISAADYKQQPVQTRDKPVRSASSSDLSDPDSTSGNTSQMPDNIAPSGQKSRGRVEDLKSRGKRKRSRVKYTYSTDSSSDQADQTIVSPRKYFGVRMQLELKTAENNKLRALNLQLQDLLFKKEEQLKRGDATGFVKNLIDTGKSDESGKLTDNKSEEKTCTEQPKESVPIKESKGKLTQKLEEKPSKIKENSSQKLTEKHTEKSVEKKTEKSKDKHGGKPKDKPTEKPPQKDAEKCKEKPAEKPQEKPTEKSKVKPKEEKTEKSKDKHTEKPKEKNTEKSKEKKTEKFKDKPPEKPKEKSTELSKEKETEKSKEKNSEKSKEKKTEKFKDKSTEKFKEKNGEKLNESKTAEIITHDDSPEDDFLSSRHFEPSEEVDHENLSGDERRDQQSDVSDSDDQESNADDRAGQAHDTEIYNFFPGRVLKGNKLKDMWKIKTGPQGDSLFVKCAAVLAWGSDHLRTHSVKGRKPPNKKKAAGAEEDRSAFPPLDDLRLTAVRNFLMERIRREGALKDEMRYSTSKVNYYISQKIKTIRANKETA